MKNINPFMNQGEFKEFSEIESHNDLCSFTVEPINNIKTAIEIGEYTEVNGSIEKYVQLPDILGVKEVYIVPLIEEINEGNEESHLRKYGLTVCKNAANYLLGIMAKFKTNEEFPWALNCVSFLAAGKENAIKIWDEKKAFLEVRMRTGDRELRLVNTDAVHNTNLYRAILAERP